MCIIYFVSSEVIYFLVILLFLKIFILIFEVNCFVFFFVVFVGNGLILFYYFVIWFDFVI